MKLSENAAPPRKTILPSVKDGWPTNCNTWTHIFNYYHNYHNHSSPNRLRTFHGPFLQAIAKWWQSAKFSELSNHKQAAYVRYQVVYVQQHINCFLIDKKWVLNVFLVVILLMAGYLFTFSLVLVGSVFLLVGIYKVFHCGML